MKKRWIAAALCLLGCAPKSANTPAPKAASFDVAKPAASAESSPAKPAFPRVLAVVRPDSTFVVYLDGDKLRASPWFHAVVAGLSSALGGIDPIGRVKKRCGFDPLAALTGLAVAGRMHEDGPGQMISAVELDRPASDALSCIARFQPGAGKTRAAGHDALVLDGHYLLVGADRMLALGAKWDMDAFDVAQPPRSLPTFAESALSAHHDATLVAAMDWARQGRTPVKTAQLVMESNQTHWVLRADIDAATPALAGRIASRVDLSKLPVDASARSVLPKIHTSVSGSRVSIELQVDGSAAVQARSVGALAAVGLYGVRRYIANAKEAEARNVIGQIAKDIAAYHATLPPGALLPPSAPLTPAAVPHGKKFQSQPKDWNHGTWRAIRFAMVDPQYYSYEIVTAKDRKSTVIRATGDLDGDGKLSHFSIAARINKDGELMIAPNILEEDPDE